MKGVFYFKGYLFDMKRTFKITESQFNKIVNNFMNESSSLPIAAGNMADIMALQWYILTIENLKGLISFAGPEGCIEPAHFPYKQGYPKQCKISGTSLCSGACYQKQAMDGIYGPKTKAAYEKYKDEKISDNGVEKTLKELMTGGDFGNNTWADSTTQSWQIPAHMTNIKAFQYYVWKVVEKDNEKDPSCTAQPCAYKSMLCGNTFCKLEKAADGYWGTNTRKAWKDYSEQYLDEGWTVITEYDDIKKYYKDNPPS